MNKRAQKYREQLYTHSHDHQLSPLPLRVTIALVSRWGPGDFYEQINRQMISFNLITRGKMSYKQGSKYGTVSQGELFIAQRGKNQRFETGDAGFLHKRTILAEGMGLDALMQVTGLTSIDRLTFDNPKPITNIFRRCYRLMREKPSGFASELSILLYSLICECCQSSTAKNPPAIRAAIEFMEQNLSGSPTLPFIATAAGLSVRNCIRLFRQHVGDSPVAFFIRLKINAACAMLTHSSLSIKQIGMEVGYEDQFHFSAQFKQRTGLSPRAFRRSFGPKPTVDEELRPQPANPMMKRKTNFIPISNKGSVNKIANSRFLPS